MAGSSITVFVTKYALTAGIQRVTARICSDISEQMIKYTDEAGWHYHCHTEGKDWHRTAEGAVARAEKMRQAKITSLQKCISALEKKKFSVDKIKEFPCLAVKEGKS